MRILHLVPGTGNFHCGVCLRDHALVRELRRAGHDAELIPLYLPLVLDEPEPNLAPVQLGGVGLYLQQNSALFRNAPRWSQQLLDAKPILRAASACTELTRARDLGVMTVGSFQCLDGPQRRAWRRLLDFLKREPRPEVISISLGLFAGMARFLKEEIGCRVVVSLQGEDVFLDSLPQPWKDESWRRLAETAPFVDRFIAPSRFYGETMSERLSLPDGKLVTIFNGVDFDVFQPGSRSPDKPTIGFLARQTHGKGLHRLVDAFIDLKRRASVPGLQLRIGGAMTAVDRRFVRTQQRKLRESGLAGDVEFHPNMGVGEKVTFLQSLSVLSVPTEYAEAFGLYQVEAMACGVPVVQPERGAFPELVASEADGRLCEADNPIALADAMESQLLAGDDGGQRLALATRARERFPMAALGEAVVSDRFVS